MSASAENRYASRLRRKFGVEDELGRYVSALFDMLGSILGADKVVLRAGKVNALKMMRSSHLSDRLCALQRLVLEDPTIERVTTRAQQRKALSEVEEAMADLVAQRSVTDSIELRGLGKQQALKICDRITILRKLIDCLAPNRRVEIEVRGISR